MRFLAAAMGIKHEYLSIVRACVRRRTSDSQSRLALRSEPFSLSLSPACVRAFSHAWNVKSGQKTSRSPARSRDRTPRCGIGEGRYRGRHAHAKPRFGSIHVGLSKNAVVIGWLFSRRGDTAILDPRVYSAERITSSSSFSSLSPSLFSLRSYSCPLSSLRC